MTIDSTYYGKHNMDSPIYEETHTDWRTPTNKWATSDFLYEFYCHLNAVYAGSLEYTFPRGRHRERGSAPDREAREVRPQRAAGLVGAEQFQVVAAEDRQVVGRAEAVLAERRQGEAEGAVAPRRLLHAVAHIHDDMVEQEVQLT